jgi:protein gp37
MADKSNIEWTESTWNPIVGCSIVSPGCTNCYAMQMASRIEAMNGAAGVRTHYRGTTRKVKRSGVWTGIVALAPDHILTQPLRWNRPRKVFVNSMGDLFHEDVPDEWIVRVLDVIRRTSWDGGSNVGKIANGAGEHTFQVLTKRAARMQSVMRRLRFDPRGDCGLYLSDDDRHPVVMKNLWLGVSAERQEEADDRISLLADTPAAVRFISAEPLLGPLDIQRYLARLDWVIVGGESGWHARPMHPDWALSLRDQCAAAGVPFFFKQWGEFTPGVNVERRTGTVQTATWFNERWLFGRENLARDNGHIDDEPDVYRVGKKAAGRRLDGSEHNAMPGRAAA